MISESGIATLRRAMHSSGRSLFATLDGARVPDVSAFLPAELRIQSLFEGKVARELAEVAPYLVSLGGSEPAIDQFIVASWGNSSIVFMASGRPFEEVRRHLRRFLKVEGPDGDEFYFRFYDPRVLRDFLPSCTLEQVGGFFGPINAIWIESEQPDMCIEFRPGPGGLQRLEHSLT